MPNFDVPSVGPDGELPPIVEEWLRTLFFGANEAYTKTQSDERYEPIDSAFTKSEADARFEPIDSAYTKGEADARYEPIDSAYTKAEADAKFVEDFLNPVAVFIGSSNSEESRGWVQDICTRNGWIKKNFSVGGGGFNIVGAGNFYNQALAAIADSSIVKANVKFVFVVDASNDTRAKTGVTSAANTLFATLETNYPNARIIVVPEVFPYTALNRSDTEVTRFVGRIQNQLRDTAASYKRVEVINNTGLWFWDNLSWVGDTEAHLNSQGYAKLRWFIEQYVNNGIEHANDLGDNTGAIASEGGAGVVHSRRVGGIVTTYGNFTLAIDQATSVAIAKVNDGFAPIDAFPVMIIRKSDGLVRTVEHDKSGNLNIQTNTPAGYYYFETSHAVL